MQLWHRLRLGVPVPRQSGRRVPVATPQSAKRFLDTGSKNRWLWTSRDTQHRPKSADAGVASARAVVLTCLGICIRPDEAPLPHGQISHRIGSSSEAKSLNADTPQSSLFPHRSKSPPSRSARHGNGEKQQQCLANFPASTPARGIGSLSKSIQACIKPSRRSFPGAGFEDICQPSAS